MPSDKQLCKHTSISTVFGSSDKRVLLTIHPLSHSGYFYSASSNPLLLRGAPDYSIDTVSEWTRRSARGKLGNCPNVATGVGFWTCDPPGARHRTYHWATKPHIYCESMSVRWNKERNMVYPHVILNVCSVWCLSRRAVHISICVA